MKRFLAVSFVGSFLFASGLSMAGYTTVYKTSYYGEAEVQTELSDNPANLRSSNTTNAGDILDAYDRTCTRTDNVSGQPWQDQDGCIAAMAAHTNSSLELSYALKPNPTGSGSSAVEIVNGSNDRPDAFVEKGAVDFADTNHFVWAITGTSTKHDFEEHNGNCGFMVTYRIIELSDGSVPSVPTYLICLEDLNDADYQDVAAEVTNTGPVPTPAAILLGSIGIALVGWLRRCGMLR